MARTSTIPNEALTYLADARFVPTASVIAVEIAVRLSKWAMRRETRKALRTLTEWELRDVGLTPDEARIEASKVFWRA